MNETLKRNRTTSAPIFDKRLRCEHGRRKTNVRIVVQEYVNTVLGKAVVSRDTRTFRSHPESKEEISSLNRS